MRQVKLGNKTRIKSERIEWLTLNIKRINEMRQKIMMLKLL